MSKHERFMFIVILSCIMCITLACFLGYHLWLISKGMTTNETKNKYILLGDLAIVKKDIKNFRNE